MHTKRAGLNVFLASAALEFAQLRANRAFVILTALAAVSLLAMVSLFGLTGAYAPVVIVDNDRGIFSALFTGAMLRTHQPLWSSQRRILRLNPC